MNQGIEHIEAHFRDKLQKASSSDIDEIVRLIKYRREIALIALETDYSPYRQRYKDATRRLKVLLVL